MSDEKSNLIPKENKFKKACVIGYPISHSLSPVIHNYWLKKYDIQGEYSAVEVAPEDLSDFLKTLKHNGFSGCNITVPHKEEAWKVLKSVAQSQSEQNKNSLPSHVANYMQAINTVVIDDEDNTIITNTDFIGFARNLMDYAPSFDYKNAHAYLIGAGGAAKAVMFALASMQVSQITITNRTRSKCEAIKVTMVENFGFPADKINIIDWENRNEPFAKCNLLVNTTSLGMKGQDALDIKIDSLPEHSIATDIIYNPLETDFLKQAREKGAFVVDGLGMLLHQAAPGFEGWFGKKPEVDSQLREKVLSYLGS